ncbi:antibiotic biosynthesis monooxygenase family protein [Chroococcidiopsis sp.]|uniref:antibiotic biosynthesis monooxygenase family protein n=1 Tax=Chroococcidiopsis sp. TaxID=3088168 RepID=UPI000B6AA085|nr:antibiotic biosynthesis monooxygenase [cyanobacterium TDX16]
MVIEIIRYNIPAGQESAFESAYEQAQQYLAESPNCLGYQLAHCVEEPNRYILRIDWDSIEGHMQGFRNSSYFPKFFQLVSPYIKSVDEMQHYKQTPIVLKK